MGGSVYIPRAPRGPLFLKVGPPKQSRTSNQNKGLHLGSRYTYVF